MVDRRISRLADLLVNYSARVGAGDWVLIGGDVSALPLIRQVYRAVLDFGGNPQPFITDERLTQTLFERASDAQLNWISPADQSAFERDDVFVNLLST